MCPPQRRSSRECANDSQVGKAIAFTVCYAAIFAIGTDSGAVNSVAFRRMRRSLISLFSGGRKAKGFPQGLRRSRHAGAHRFSPSIHPELERSASGKGAPERRDHRTIQVRRLCRNPCGKAQPFRAVLFERQAATPPEAQPQEWRTSLQGVGVYSK
jgi:hypothetical protein